MPLSLEEAVKRFENYSDNIQDSILIMESHMGSLHSFSFDLPQVITNLDRVDIKAEERNVSAYVKVLEEYQRILAMEKKRRSIKEVIEVKEESADFKANLKKKRRSQRLGIIFKPNVLPAMAAAGQMPPRMPPPNPARQMPPPNAASQMPQPNAASQMPQPNATSQMPQPNAASQMPPLNAALMQEPTIEEIPSNVQDEFMLEL